MSVETVPVVLDVDLSAGVPCSNPECTVDATWVATNQCPGHHRSCVCETHRCESVRWAAWAHRTNVHVTCTTCGTPLTFPYQTWRPL